MEHAPSSSPDDAGEAVPEPAILTARHAITLLPGMESVLQAIIGDVDAARTRVSVETYIYRDDKLGRMFADVLARAAARGVRTRLLYDPLGSEQTSPDFFVELRSRDIDARPYRPADVLMVPGTFPRDHSRVVVVDENAYTGGAAWGDEWLPLVQGGKGWHDVCLRLKGPCVEDFGRLFEQRWREALGDPVVPVDLTTGNKYPDVELVGDTPGTGNLVYDRHRRMIQRARRRVWIENAYFFPPAALMRDLYAAAARGVDVQVILPGETDLPILKRAARAEFRTWLDRGLGVFEFQKGMVHSKFAVIDDDWCTIGTFNANPTSTGLANEVNVFVFDPAFVARVARLFEADRQLSREVTREALDSRPLFEQTVDRLANDALNLVDLLIGPPPPSE